MYEYTTLAYYFLKLENLFLKTNPISKVALMYSTSTVKQFGILFKQFVFESYTSLLRKQTSSSLKPIAINYFYMIFLCLYMVVNVYFTLNDYLITRLCLNMNCVFAKNVLTLDHFQRLVLQKQFYISLFKQFSYVSQVHVPVYHRNYVKPMSYCVTLGYNVVST